VPKFVLYLIIIVPAVLVGLGIAVYIFQEHLIFYPEKLSDKYQFQFEGEFDELNYTTDDGEIINALLFKAKDSKGVIYYHHGNAGCLETWGTKAVDFTKKGYDVLIYDYRGFGKSTGKIKNEKMLYSDAVMIYKKLTYDYKERDIVVYGTSLGTGIAAKLAHDNHPKQLILETPYYNFYDVSKFHYPYLPNSILLHYQFKTDKLLPQIKVPIYLFHGTEDETVPYNSSVRLEKLSDNVKLFTIKDGSHNNLNSYDDYHIWLSEILEN
jgi:uncharacterized protein